MYAENVPTVLRNQTVISNYILKSTSQKLMNKISGDCSYPLSRTQAARKQKQKNT